jgi:hypothetical protein
MSMKILLIIIKITGTTTAITGAYHKVATEALIRTMSPAIYKISVLRQALKDVSPQ